MILSGFCRLGKTAELRFTPSGEPVCNLSLAFSYGKKGEDGKRPTTWVDAALWGKRAEALVEYLVAGQPLDVVLTDVRIELYKKGDGGTGAALRGNVQVIDFAGKGPERDEQPAKRAEAPAKRDESDPLGLGKPGDRFSDFDSDSPF